MMENSRGPEVAGPIDFGIQDKTGVVHQGKPSKGRLLLFELDMSVQDAARPLFSDFRVWPSRRPLLVFELEETWTASTPLGLAHQNASWGYFFISPSTGSEAGSLPRSKCCRPTTSFLRTHYLAGRAISVTGSN